MTTRIGHALAELWLEAARRQIHIAPKNDATLSRLRAGTLFSAGYDAETTSVEPRAVEFTQVAGTIRDLAGNLQHIVDLRGKPSGHAVFHPRAWVIQRMRRDDLDKGDPQYVLAGKVMQFFRHASRLHEAPFAQKFLRRHCKSITVMRSGRKEKAWAYPLKNDDGSVDWDSVYIHKNLRRYSYREPKAGGRWITRDIQALCYGYNNIKADDHWIWTSLHMALAENIFVTHLPKFGKHRMDILRAVEVAALSDAKDENALKPGTAIHPQTREPVMSFRQGDILKANTRLASELRGIAEGITLPDGSHPDLDQLHGALPDILALDGIVDYMHIHNPETIGTLQKHSDWRIVEEELTANPHGWGDHPLMGYVDKANRKLSGHIVCLVGADQARYNPKMTLLLNLDVDPETYRFKGRKLEEMTPAEHAELINESRSNPGGPYKIIFAHHSPRLVPAKKGFAAGFHKGLDEKTLKKRARLARKQPFIKAALKGMRMAMPRPEGPERLILPQPEEELFSFPAPEVYDPETGQDAQIHLVLNPLDKHLQDSRKHIFDVNKLWRRALQSDEDILLGDFSKDPDAAHKAAEKFFDKMKEISKKLGKHGGPRLPDRDDLPETDDPAQDAWNYKIKLLHAARKHYEEGALKDISHHYWFENKDGQEIPEKEIRAWPDWRVDNAFATHSIRVRHEEIWVTPPIIDRVLTQLGYGHILGPEVEEQVEAQRRLRTHGIPQLGQDKQRWMTAEKGWREAQKIRNNEISGEDMVAYDEMKPGLWEIDIDNHPDAQASLAEYEEYIKALREVPFTPRDKLLVGIDPATGHERQNVVNPVEENRVVRLRVPDRYIEDPAIDPRTNRPVWLVPLTPQFNGLVTLPPGPVDILLESAGTAKIHHLANARFIAVPPRGGINDNFYRHAQNRFADSRQPLPETGRLMALTGEGPYPLHDLRAVNDKAQTLHVPQRLFEGLMDHRLASYAEKPSGRIFRDDYLQLKEGPVRLLELGKEGSPTGWEAETDIVKVRYLSVNTVSLLSDKRAQRYGYATADALRGDIARMFSDKRVDAFSPKSKVWVVDFGDISPRHPEKGTTYHNPKTPKLSALRKPFKP